MCLTFHRWLINGQSEQEDINMRGLVVRRCKQGRVPSLLLWNKVLDTQEVPKHSE